MTLVPNLIIKRLTSLLLFLLLSSGALADEFVGRASVVDGDTLEIHGIRIRLWGVDAPESTQLCRGEDSLQYRCGAQAANDLDAFIARRPVNARRLTSTHMAGRSRPVRSAVQFSANGLFARGSRWIGPNTRKADTIMLSAMPSAPAGESGKAATSSRGSIALASARMGSRPVARMMQTRIPDLYTQPSRSVLLASLGRLTLPNRH